MTAARRKRSSVTQFVLFAALAIAGTVVALRLGYAPANPPAVTADFTALTDTDGKPAAMRLAGHYKLVAYGYTSCPEACPATLTKMHVVLTALRSDMPTLVPVFVTLDPEHDTPDVLASYVQHFDPRVVGITGARAALEASAARLSVLPRDAASARTPDGGPNHAVRLYLLGPDNAVLQSYELADATSLIANDLRRRVAPTG
jgi:protein SCO1/2